MALLTKNPIPEVKADVRFPDLELPRFERPKVDLPAAIPTVDLDRVAATPGEIGKALAGAASAIPIGPRPRRGPRRLAAVALIAAALAGWAIATNAALRERLIAGIESGRQRVSAWLSGGQAMRVDVEEPVAFTAAETQPIKESPLAPDTNRGTPDYPEGLGADDHVPTGTPVTSTPEATS